MIKIRRMKIKVHFVDCMKNIIRRVSDMTHVLYRKSVNTIITWKSINQPSMDRSLNPVDRTINHSFNQSISQSVKIQLDIPQIP